MENFKEKMQKSGMDTCNRWGIYEVALDGPKEGNPFTEQRVTGTFHSINETVSCDGFYDGDGIYRIRFMPSFEGEYTYQIQTTFGKEYEGHFTVIKPKENAHGPVRVANTYHMAYEDGTPYYSIGTTCYVWELQSDELIEQTFDTLKNSAFNKIRFCIFPKHYDYNLGEPRSYPYEGTPMDSTVLTKDNFQEYTGKTEGNHFDLTRFNPAHFRHIEWCVEQLQALGIEADLIVMHPYDRWGFSCMTREQDHLYWRYVLARFAAYRNIWWSLANEYDIFPHKTIEDWESYAKLICEHDPYHHLRSIHNCIAFYDHSRPWVTHCSIQRQDIQYHSRLVALSFNIIFKLSLFHFNTITGCNIQLRAAVNRNHLHILALTEHSSVFFLCLSQLIGLCSELLQGLHIIQIVVSVILSPLVDFFPCHLQVDFDCSGFDLISVKLFQILRLLDK